MLHTLRISSRKSSLAKLQSYLVAEEITKFFPNLQIEFIFKESTGDKDLQTPLWKISDKGIFTRDFRDDLLQNKTDLVIHSYKDLDLEESEGTKIISVLQRADQRDILLYKRKFFIDPDFSNLKILTSSPRREYNLKIFFSYALPLRLQTKNLIFEPVRGNIQTRILKWFQSDDSQGIILAKAALDRLLSFEKEESLEYSEIQKNLRHILSESLFMCLPLSVNPNAPAQGALAAEFRKNDTVIEKIVQKIKDDDTEECVIEERKILKSFGGGCHQKIGVSIFKRNYGKIKILKGLTDKNETLDEISLASDRTKKALSEKKIWPTGKNSFKWKRTPIANFEFPKGRDLFVSRGNALNNQGDFTGAGTNIIWTAGISTVKDLAKKDLWVSGTSDGFGETEFINIEVILGRKPNFVKLTHDDSDRFESTMAKFYTYNLSDPEIFENLSEKTHFYWMSGTIFDYALSVFPQIKNKSHACGPGITYKHIRKKLGDESIVEIFLNFEDWKKYQLGE